MENSNLPISTQWLLESSGSTNQGIIKNVFLIYCQNTGSKGTGFLLKTGHIITNWHVVQGCLANQIIALSSEQQKIDFKDVKIDENRDLVILTPSVKLSGGLEIDEATASTETKVITWGHPLGYNGPAPILSVGYIAGFQDYKKSIESNIVKHYVVNGAFNPGNSGGPLIIQGSEKVIGIVVAKHAPTTKFLQSALQVLAQNGSGVVFAATNESGQQQQFVESQVVAMLLEHQQKMTQVMIGQAIASSELTSFLKEQGIEEK